VRTPLNITLIGLELFEKDFAESNSTLGSNVLLTVKEIKDSCHAAVDVLNSILLYDKIVNGRMVMELEKTAVWPLLVNMTELMQLQVRYVNRINHIIFSINNVYTANLIFCILACVVLINLTPELL